MTPPAWAKPLAAGLHSLSLWFSANAAGDDLLRLASDSGRPGAAHQCRLCAPLQVTHTNRRLSPDPHAQVRQAFEAHLGPEGATFYPPQRVDVLKKPGWERSRTKADKVATMDTSDPRGPQ